jgi:type II secretory pathway pseudopilin PulG
MKTFVTGLVAAGLISIMATPSAAAQLSQAQWQTEAEEECEKALRSGNLEELRKVRDKYWRASTACTTRASTTAVPTDRYADGPLVRDTGGGDTGGGDTGGGDTGGGDTGGGNGGGDGVPGNSPHGDNGR